MKIITNKFGKVLLDNILWLILLVLVVLVALFFLFGNNISDWIVNLPGYEYDYGDDELDMSELPEDYLIQLNYFKVATIVDGTKVKFCTSGDCSKLRNSKLYWEGGEKIGKIYVVQNGLAGVDMFDLDNEIAVVKDRVIIIDKNIISGRGRLYLEVKRDLPVRYDLLNLNNAIYISGTIYREKEINYKEISESRNVSEVVKPGSEDVSKYVSNWNDKKNSYKSDWILLKPEIENSNGETGFDSGSWDGDDLEYIQYAKEDDKFWIRFMDDDRFGNDITPWISMDWWNKFRSFADVAYEHNGNLIRGLNN